MIAASVSIPIAVLAPVEKNSDGDGEAAGSVPFGEPVAHVAVEFEAAVAVAVAVAVGGTYCSVLVRVMVVCEVQFAAGAEAAASVKPAVTGELSLTALAWSRAEDTRAVENGSNNDGVACDEAADGTRVSLTTSDTGLAPSVAVAVVVVVAGYSKGSRLLTSEGSF